MGTAMRGGSERFYTAGGWAVHDRVTSRMIWNAVTDERGRKRGHVRLPPDNERYSEAERIAKALNNATLSVQAAELSLGRWIRFKKLRARALRRLAQQFAKELENV